jgi:hypothetical protein
MNATKMAEPHEVIDSVANPSRRKLLETAERFHSKDITVQKLQPSHSADAKLPDLTPSATISIPLSACVLKAPVWRTEFVTHT